MSRSWLFARRWYNHDGVSMCMCDCMHQGAWPKDIIQCSTKRVTGCAWVRSQQTTSAVAPSTPNTTLAEGKLRWESSGECTPPVSWHKHSTKLGRALGSRDITRKPVKHEVGMAVKRDGAYEQGGGSSWPTSRHRRQRHMEGLPRYKMCHHECIVRFRMQRRYLLIN